VELNGGESRTEIAPEQFAKNEVGASAFVVALSDGDAASLSADAVVEIGHGVSDASERDGWESRSVSGTTEKKHLFSRSTGENCDRG